MVRIALVAHLDDEGVLGTRRLARGNQVVVGGGSVAGQGVVTNQGDRLNGVGNTVGLAVVGHSLDGHVGELGLGFAQVDGGDDTVSDERTELVVCHNDQVGAVAGGHLGGELGVHVSLGLLNNIDSNARLGREVTGESLDLRETSVVRPDREGRRRVVVGRGRGGVATASSQGGDRRKGAECYDATSHIYSCVGRAGRLHQRPAISHCNTSVFVSATIFRIMNQLLHWLSSSRAHTPKGELSR